MGVFTPESGVLAAVLSAPIAPIPGVALVSALGSEAKTNMLGMTEFTITPTLTGGKIIAAGCPADAQGNIAPRQTRGGVVETKVALKAVMDGDVSTGSDARFAVGGFLYFDLIYNTVTGLGRYRNQGRIDSPPTSTKVGPDSAELSVEIVVDGFISALSLS